jgi:hypothetical protein
MKDKILLLGLAALPAALQIGLSVGDIALHGGGGHIISALLNSMTPLHGGGGHIISAPLNPMTPLHGGGGH